MTTPYTLKHFKIALGAFFVALGLGTLAFWAVLHEDAFSSFYRATVTISLTGIDTKPHTHGGQVVTILVILAGMAIYGYLASAIVELIAHGVLSGVLTERRKNRVIRGLRDHYIICGYGRVGRRVGHEFRDAGAQYIVLDFTPNSRHFAEEDRVPYVEGTGTRDEDLEAVGLAQAKGLVASSDSDVDNLYIVVSARAVAAGPVHRRARLHRGRGAQDVARRRRPRRPAVHRRPGRRWRSSCCARRWRRSSTSSRAPAAPTCAWRRSRSPRRCDNAGKSIRDLHIGRDTGALVVALRKPDGSFDTTPSADATIDARRRADRGRDRLGAAGARGDVQAARDRCRLEA